jgi:hypothetical protein
VLVMFRLSVPLPPFKLSPAVKDCTPVVLVAAVNVSLPAVLVVPAEPTNVPDTSTPAVSGPIPASLSC